MSNYEEKLHSIENICDFILAISYYIIPIQLIYFLRQFPHELPWKCHAILVLFASFIVLCGTTHLIHVLQLGLFDIMIVKVLTAAISFITALTVWWVFGGALEYVRRTRQVEIDMFHQSTTVKRAQDLMKESQQHKNDFLAVLSHELRNQLNIINANSMFLMETSLTADQKEHGESIESSAKLMVVILNDVLDLSRLEAGRMSFEKEPFSLYELCKQVVRNQQQMVGEKKLSLILEYDSSAPHGVISDALRIQQVLINLISNALKFTIEGSVTLRVTAIEAPRIDEVLEQERRRLSHDNKPAFEKHANFTNYFSTAEHLVSPTHPRTKAFINARAIKIRTRPPPSNSSSSLKLFDEKDMDGLNTIARSKIKQQPPAALQVTFQVIDTGIGISTTAMPELFVPYKQAKLSTVRSFGGTGLGLSIVHQIISNLRGSIYVISEINQGSMFVVQLILPSLTLEQFQHVSKPVELPAVPMQRPSGSKALMRQSSFSGRASRRSPPSPLIERPSSVSRERRHSFSGLGSQNNNSKHHNNHVRGTSDGSNDNNKPTNTTTSLLKSVLMNQQPSFQHLGSMRRQSAPCISIPLVAGAGHRLLLVDDNNINLRILQRMISSLIPGAILNTAGDGLQAVQAVVKSNVDKTPYSLIWMDLSMPVLNGFEASSRIRAAGNVMPIIALTANALAEEKLKAESCGMNDFTMKPINKTELKRLLNKWLNLNLK